MAITADLNRAAVTAPGTTSSWTDDSDYTTGGNPDRDEMAVYLTAYKVSYSNSGVATETALEVTAFDPESATAFTTENDDDGHHKYYFVIVERWSVGTTYEEFDLVWSESEEAFYEYTNAASSAGNLVTDGTYWTVIEDPTTKIADVGTDEESGNLIYEVVNKILDYQTSICYLKASSKHARLTCSGDSCGCDTKLGRNYHRIRDLFANMVINETTGQYMEGERNARLAEKWCDDCGCLTR